MQESQAAIKKLLAECSREEQEAIKRHLRSLAPHPLEEDWDIDADDILSAIRRSNDIMKRGVRGIIAEAVFERSALPKVEKAGWKAETIVGDRAYDCLLSKDSSSVRIQIKLQRLDKGEPFLFHRKHYEENSLYVVEVQRTRTGKKKKKKLKLAAGEHEVVVETTKPVNEQTRPYSFSDFDILAVNMHPSSRNWENFRYTVSSWLLPRPKDESLIETMQPVAAKPNDVWTDDLSVCIQWLASGEKRKVLTDLLHRKTKEKNPATPEKISAKKARAKKNTLTSLQNKKG